MFSFLKSMDNKTCKVMVKGWKYPVNIAQDGIDAENDLNDAEDNEALGNSKALNSIFNGVDKNMFRLINTSTKAKYY